MTSHGNGHLSFAGDRKNIRIWKRKRNRFGSIRSREKKSVWIPIPASAINNGIAIRCKTRRPDVSVTIGNSLKSKFPCIWRLLSPIRKFDSSRRKMRSPQEPAPDRASIETGHPDFFPYNCEQAAAMSAENFHWIPIVRRFFLQDRVEHFYGRIASKRALSGKHFV